MPMTLQYELEIDQAVSYISYVYFPNWYAVLVIERQMSTDE